MKIVFKFEIVRLMKHKNNSSNPLKLSHPSSPAGAGFSPYWSMSNNPIALFDPDGRFYTWAGAMAYWMTHGFKGEVMRHSSGDWFVGDTYFDEEFGVSGISSTYGWDWETNNKDRIAIGSLVGLNLNAKGFVGGNINANISRVSFLKFPYSASYYASIAGGPVAGTEIDLSVGGDTKFFVGYYDGDPNEIKKDAFKGDYIEGQLAVGVSTIGDLSVTVSYLQATQEEYKARWHVVVSFGVHGSVGLQVAPTGLVKVEGSVNFGRSTYLGSFFEPFGVSSAIDHFFYKK